MATRPDYKFKPYSPRNLKIATSQSSLTQQEKTLKSLQTQRANLDARLRAEGIDPDTLGGELDNRSIIERALNLRPNQGFLMDFIEVINRPVEAVKSALVAGVDGEDVLKGAWEGISGQAGEGQEWGIRGSEVLKKVTGIDPQTGVGKFIADVGIDIALDPLTYVPGGYFLKGMRKLTSKTIKETIVRSDDIMKATLREIVRQNPLQKGETVVDLLRRVGKADTDLVMFAGKVDDFTEAAYKAGDGYNSTVKGLEERAKYIDKVIKGDGILRQTKSGVDVKVFDYVKVENQLYNRYKKMIEAIDPNLKVVMTSTGNTQSDILILRKYSDDLYVKVGGLEAKKLSGSMATTATLEITGKGTKRALKFASGGFEFGEIGGKLDALLKKSLKNGDTLEKALLKTYDAASGSLDIPKLLKNEPKLLQEYNTLIFDMMQKKGIDTLFFATPGGKELILSLSDARQFVSIKGGVMFSTSGGKKMKLADFTKMIKEIGDGKKISGTGSVKIKELLRALEPDKTISIQEIAKRLKAADIDELLKTYQRGNSQFRLRPTLAINKKQLEAIEEAGVALSDDVVIGRIATTTQDRTVGIIEYLAETRTDRVGEIAQAFNRFNKNFFSLFNAKLGFSKQSATKMKQIMGDSMFELERRSARLAAIKQQLIKVDPKAGELVGQLIEAGAYIDDAGRIVTMKRRFGTSDFLDYVYSRTAVKGKSIVPLPQFANDAARLNVVKQLNKFATDAFSTPTEIFEIITKGDGTILKFKGTTAELDEILKYVQDQSLLGKLTGDTAYVNFGKKNLSTQAKELLTTQSDLIKEYSRLSDDILRELVEKAGFDNLPEALQGQIGYMRHIMSKEAYESLQKTMPGALSRYAKPGRDTLAKRNYLGSTQELNAAFKEFANLDVNLFDPDAFNAMEDLVKIAQRKIEQHDMLALVLNGTDYQGKQLFRVVENTQEAKRALGPLDRMFKSFSEEFKPLYKNLSPESQRRLDGFLKAAGFGDDTAVVMNKSAYDVLKRVEKAYVDLPGFVKTYDKFLNFWKGVTLVTPGFHLRNMFGNMFNSYAVGMGIADQGVYLSKAMTELSEFQRIGRKLAAGEVITKAERELFELTSNYFRQGISQTHRGLRDLDQLKEFTELTKQAGKVKTTYNNLLRFNFNVAEKMDDVQRYALYRWSLDKTGDATKAANTVAESLFDYSNLTHFEKEYMKRLFPFYTFMKNNFIFQAKNIFANPKQYARTGRAYRYAVEDLAGYNQDDLPDYATENMWIPIPMTITKNDKKAIMFLKANLPLSDFTELVENPFKKGVISITAPVKLLIEFGAGRDLFTGAPLQNFPGETNAMEPGTGVLSGLRDRRGNLTITQSPLFQKILNDIGLRTPINVASAGVDLVDTLTGYQGPVEGLGDFLARAGIVGVQEVERIELTALYQDLENLRELKNFYEQETRNQLPVLPRG